MPISCLYCFNEIYAHQSAISCNTCLEFCHISCDTGISDEAFVEGNIIWACLVCRTNSEEIRASHLSPLEPLRVIQEDALEVEDTRQHNHIPTTLSYQIIISGNQRKGELLLDNRGYSYSKKIDSRYTTVYWKCTHKNHPTLCKAGVFESGTSYTPTPIGNPHVHICQPDTTKANFSNMRTQLFERSLKENYTSASVLIDDALLADDRLVACIPKKNLLVDYINKYRSSGRPQDVTGNMFQINLEHIPNNFLRSDISVEGARHIIFMTDKQIDILSNAKVWYLDGTFNIINRPFQQLFGIHCFVKSGVCIKQFPACFVCMTQRRYVDYVEVLSAIRNLLPRIRLVRCMLDFEKQAWRAIQHVFNVEVKGCLFHYSQVYHILNLYIYIYI